MLRPTSVCCAVLLSVVAASLDLTTTPRQSSTLTLVEGPLDWAAAAEFCRGLNGHLAYTHSDVDAAEMTSLLADAGIAQAHIGFHDLFGEGRYNTIQAEPITSTCYSQWAPGYPLGGLASNCGALGAEGLMDVACSENLPFICEHNPFAGEYVTIAGHGHYKHYGDIVRATWNDAVNICHQDGAHLLVLNSQEELTAVYERFRYTTTWIGIHHLLVDREFLTTSDVPMEETGFSRWFTGEPSGSNLDFPYVQMRDTMGYWINGGVSNFICERHL